MKCWKCGKDLPNGTSVCIYCNASITRYPTKTAVGAAMRKVYDQFGCNSVFEPRSILVTALGDLLEDAKVLRNQIDLSLSAGVGKLYLNQLANHGKPDAAFRVKVRTLIVEEAGLSDKAATTLMGYFDEMIGWSLSESSSPPPPPPNPKKPDPSVDKKQPHIPHDERPRPHVPHDEKPRPHVPPKNPYTPHTPHTPPSPNPVTPQIPLPTAPVPAGPLGCGTMLAQIFLSALIAAGIYSFFTGMWLVGIILVIIGMAGFSNMSNAPAGTKKITCSNAPSTLILTWDGPIEKFAIAVGGKWVLTGTGSSASLALNLFTQYKPGEPFTVVLAEITSSGVKYCGEIRLQNPKKQ